MDISKVIAGELGIQKWQTDAVIRLIDEGNTIPFIARYRKEQHGALDDEKLRALDERLKYLRGLEDRKKSILSAIEEQGKLTRELSAKIEEAMTQTALADLYRPYKQKRKTRGSIAREKGLQPLADYIKNKDAKIPVEQEAAKYVDPAKDIPDAKTAIKMAEDILAEEISDSAAFRAYIRDLASREGTVVSAKAAAKSKKKVEAPPQPEYDDEEDEYEDEEGEEEEDLENNSFINNEDEEEGGEEERSNKAIYLNDDIFKQEKKKQEKIKKEKNEDDEDEDYKVEDDYKREKEKEVSQIKEEKSEDNDLSDKLNESDLEIGKQFSHTKKRRLLKKGKYQKEADNLRNDYSDEGRDNSENDIRTNSYEDDDNVRPHRKKRKEDNFIDDNDIGERRHPFMRKSQAGIEQIEEYISKEDKEIVNADYPERLLERYSIDELKNLSQEIKEEVEWISEQKNYNDFINKKKKINTLLELYKKDFLDIPYIITYKFYLFEHDFTEKELWEIFELDYEYQKLLELKKKVMNNFASLEPYLNEKIYQRK